MNKKRLLLIVLTVLLLLPGMVYAEPAEQAGEAAANLNICTAPDGSTYALTESEGEVIALTVPGTDGEGILTIGPEIDGKTVKYLDAGYIPEDTATVFLPAGAELLNKERLEHEILVYSYKDYEMIHRQSSIMFHLTAVEPGEFALTDAARFLPGGESEPLKQEYYEYPAELNGRRLYNCLAKRDYFNIYRSGSYSYYKISENEIGICECMGAGVTVTVPEQIDGMTVAALNSLDSKWVISAGKKTKSVTFPSTLRLLGDHAFYADRLSSVKIPESVTEFGSYAIKGDRIKSITIPAGVKTIGVNAIDINTKALKLPDTVEKLAERAFVNSKYTTISLPEGMKAVPRELCMNCMKLGHADIPETVVRIGENAFKGCRKLKAVTIPAEVSEIAAGAFSGCTNLKTVDFKGSLIRKIDKEVFAGCGFGKLVVADGIEEIGERAFAGCARMTGAEIPDSVTAIGPGAFRDCKKLQNVRMTASVQAIADDAFENCAKKLTFTVPEGSYAMQWAESKGFRVKIAKQK